MDLSKYKTSFKVKDTLNQELWNKDKSLKKEIRLHLLKIIKRFIKYINIDNLKIEDIIINGSLANYNWSKYSDIDIDIVIDFSSLKGDPKIINDFFYDKKIIWNRLHNITVKGFDVELYITDVNNNLGGISTGIYSILKDKWIKKPKKEEFKIDINSAIKKAKKLKKEIDMYLKKDCDSSCIEKLEDKIYKFRKIGLDKSGESSPENIAYKLLKRSGYLDKLKDIKNNIIDKELSLIENV